MTAASQAPAPERFILLLDHRPPAYALVDRFGWTFWFCHRCGHIDHFEQPLSREQLSRYTRGHYLFCTGEEEQ